MSWASDTKVRLQVFAIGLGLVCPGLLIWQAPDLSRQIASTSWPHVPGAIQGVTAKTWLDKDNSTKYYGRAVYRYAVDGKEYTSDLTDLGPGAKRADLPSALADVRQYRPGMQVTVYYDPSDPAAGILETGIPPVLLALAVALIIGTVIGWITAFFTVRAWLKNRKANASSVATPPSQQPIPDSPLDGDGIVREFGTPLDAFKPGLENMVAGLILGGLLMAGGGAALFFMGQVVIREGKDLPWHREIGHCWLSVLLLSALGLGALVGGTFLIRWIRRLYSLRVLICPKGLVQVDRLETLACRWEDVAEIQETVLREHLPLLKGGLKYALPSGSSKSYVVRRRDGKEFGFDRNCIKGLRRLAEHLRREAESRGIPWKTVEESD
jgi:Protein of unknown function (DUF3592)